MSGWDVLGEEAREKLGAWPAKARALFKELVEDASSEMQRELLQRAVAAGHSPAEIHAFATPTAKARTRAMTPTRSVTEIAPRASRMLK